MAGSIDSALQRVATRWAGMLTTISKEFAPNHIKGHIHSSSSKNGDGKYSISISVDMIDNAQHKYGSMDARAQEFGSGERATSVNNPKATLGPIMIYPRDKKYLVFNWDRAESNPVYARKVRSPGIFPYKGSGYLGVAVDELKNQGKTDLSIEMQAAITRDLRIAFKNAK